MTDTFRPPATLTGQNFQPLGAHAAAAAAATAPVVDYAHFASHHAHGMEEDDGQIDCICGFNEDDGNTVACDTCNKWQHIICYYPEYGDSLPDELQHYCVECRPTKYVNRQAARDRQRDARTHRLALQNGVKRQPTKSHKKKVKDTPVAGHPNGWPMDKSRHDRNSASPRDLQPPTKRPKTSHRASNSTANTISTQSRKRNGSTVHNRRSLSRSPDSLLPIPLYSNEFIRAYRADDYQVPATNVMGIPIYDAMSRWLVSPEEVLSITGVQLHQILQRYDGDLSIIHGPPTLEIQEASDPRYTSADGRSAAWKYVTVSEALAKDACIGELRGRLEFKEEYTTDPANRWSLLRHPEPFVFLHPNLPICIDARHEGTAVRYIRRSCIPNAELRVIITGQSDYHFCFIALRDIEPGEEIAIAWESSSALWDPHRRSVNGVPTEDMPILYTWVSTVLANCGPCACGRPEADCLMARLDKRDPTLGPEDEPAKMRKVAGKRKKGGQHVSPLNTQAVNSRSGSEIRRVEPDDDPTDSRSASGSVGRGTASRDITPNTHYSANGTTEMSERERKKLAKVEELFSKQEEEGSVRLSKKKRSSAGSALNTPNPPSSKHFGLASGVTSSRYSDAGPTRNSGQLAHKSASGRRPKPANTARLPSKPAAKSIKVPKPVYAEMGLQCDLDEEEAAKLPPRPCVRRPFISLQQRLLERCARNNAMRKEQLSSMRSLALQRSKVEYAASAPTPTSQPSHSPQAKTKDREPSPQQLEDVEMEDATSDETAVHAPAPDAESHKPSPAKSSPLPSGSPAPAHPPTDPPPPPWPAEAPATTQAASPEPASVQPEPASAPPPEPTKAQDMQLIMPPPPPANPFSATSQPSANLAPGSLTGTLAQSPAPLGPSTAAAPIFSPSVTAAVNPSPARKKLSLSDYTRRTKAKDKEPEPPRTERESSPASVASAPGSAPMLQSAASESGKPKEDSAAPTIEEDTRMEDPASAPSPSAAH